LAALHQHRRPPSPPSDQPDFASTISPVSDTCAWVFTQLGVDVHSKLRTVSVFRGMTDEQRLRISRALAITKYEDGAQIVTQNQPGHTLFLIVRGMVLISVDGRPTTMTMGPGKFFGEMALLCDAPPSASVSAMMPVWCLTLTRDYFSSLFPNFRRAMKRVIESRAPVPRAAVGTSLPISTEHKASNEITPPGFQFVGDTPAMYGSSFGSISNVSPNSWTTPNEQALGVSPLGQIEQMQMQPGGGVRLPAPQPAASHHRVPTAPTVVARATNGSGNLVVHGTQISSTEPILRPCAVQYGSGPGQPGATTGSHLGVHQAPRFPESAPLPARAVWNFSPQADGQLHLRRGDLVEVLSHADADWWLIRIGQNIGYAPASFITPMAQISPAGGSATAEGGAAAHQPQLHAHQMQQVHAQHATKHTHTMPLQMEILQRTDSVDAATVMAGLESSQSNSDNQSRHSSAMHASKSTEQPGKRTSSVYLQMTTALPTAASTALMMPSNGSLSELMNFN
jgi:hypothetical protein